jgi:hypothetical protein
MKQRREKAWKFGTNGVQTETKSTKIAQAVEKNYTKLLNK